MFTTDDSRYKATIATELRNFQAADENQSIEEKCSSKAKKVIVIDGMAIVNKINVANRQISNCDDFAKCFTDMTTNETEDCHESRVVINRYDQQSLENNARSNRTKGHSAVHYF